MSAVLRPVEAWDPTLLVFDAARHEYHYDGVYVPSVTTVMDGLHSFAGVSWEVLQAAKERGSHVHMATQFYDENDLDEESLTPTVRAYLEGWKRFTRDCDPCWAAIEQPVYHPVLRYCGTPDRFGELTVKGRRIPVGQVDIKTGLEVHPCWGVQTIAYNQAARHPNAPRFTCQLRPDGTYRLVEWTDPQDWPVFVSLLTLRTWKERNSL